MNISTIKDLVDRYLECWKKHRPNYSGIYEDNDFGCENMQIFRNDFEIETFSHEELCQLSVLLTRSLRGQINRDHKMFWAWCSFLAFQFSQEVQLFQDNDWKDAFRSLVNLLLASRKQFLAGPEFIHIYKEAQKYVNQHLLEVGSDKYIVAAPLAFAVVEGLLRRKNRSYVEKNGIVCKSFRIVNLSQEKTCEEGNRLNRIDDSLRLFEQIVVDERRRQCLALGFLKDEIAKLYPGTTDVYDLIDSWRNNLIHGGEYWQNITPIILNLTCLLVIDEILPAIYDSKKAEIQNRLQWQKEIGLDFRASWDIFPPDL